MTRQTTCFFPVASFLLVVGGALNVSAREPDVVLDIWPGNPPGPAMEVGAEKDTTGPDGRRVAGKRVIRLGNVAKPQVHVFLPPQRNRNGAAVVICPGGGFSILAWDLEGTEVADWLNSLGVTAVVLKYRVPTRERDLKWLAPTQDAQRAISLTRSYADEWNVDAQRVGVLGFSAGGKTAAMAALLPTRKYEPVDQADAHPHRPDFAVLVYAAYLATEDNQALREENEVTAEAPPMFLVHAFDDGVRVENSLLLAMQLKRHKIPFDLHVYAKGGHGYGLRETELPVTKWHHRCGEWLAASGFLRRRSQ